MLRVLDLVRREIPDVKLYLVGKGESPQDQAGGNQDEQAASKDGQPSSKGQAGQPKAASKSGAPKASPKAAGEKSPKEQPPTTPKASLAEAEKNQKAIVDEIENMLNGLSRFDETKDLIKDGKALLKQQEQARKEAADVAGREDMKNKPASVPGSSGGSGRRAMRARNPPVPRSGSSRRSCSSACRRLS